MLLHLLVILSNDSKNRLNDSGIFIRDAETGVK